MTAATDSAVGSPVDWPELLGLPAARCRRVAAGIDWWTVEAAEGEAPLFALAQGGNGGAAAALSPGIAGVAAELAGRARAAGAPFLLFLQGPGAVAGEIDTGLEAIRTIRQSLATTPTLVVTLGPVRGPLALLPLDAAWWIAGPPPAGARLFGPDFTDWAGATPGCVPEAESAGASPDGRFASRNAAILQAGLLARFLAAASTGPVSPPQIAPPDEAAGLPDPGDPERPGDLAAYTAALADGAALLTLTGGQEGALTALAGRIGGYPALILAGNGTVAGGTLSAADCRHAARLLRLARATGIPAIWLNDGPGFRPTEPDGPLLAATAALGEAAAGGTPIFLELSWAPTGLAAALPFATVCRPAPDRLSPAALRADLIDLLAERRTLKA